jgi:alcohol dehydrogenase
MSSCACVRTARALTASRRPGTAGDVSPRSRPGSPRPSERARPARVRNKVPDELSDEQVLFLADILPTSYEVGVLNGMVTPGDVVAIVGAGPIGLAAILTARLYTPGRIVAIDLADSRLESAARFGADTTINNGREDALAQVMELTDGLGADVAFEAVGVPQTFELAAELIRPCGRVANIGVHGQPVTLHLEKLWIRDVTVTTGLVDTYTIPRLMKLVSSGRLDPTIFATHHFALGETMSAYDTFADAASTHALKVVLEGSEGAHGSNGRIGASVAAGGA